MNSLPRMLLQLLFFALCLLHTVWTTSDVACGQETGLGTFTPEQSAEYERKLNAILKTRLNEEKIFVTRVVEKVRVGILPSKLIQTSYLWARNKRPGTKYPFIYFERILRLQADKIGLGDEVPPFDFAIYSQSEGQIPNESILTDQETQPEGPVSDQSVFQRLFSVFR